MKGFFIASAVVTLGFTGQAMAQDGAKGATLFQQRCTMCHAAKAGAPNRMGPNLFGVVGRKAGTLAGYNYSPAMAKSGLVWDVKALDSYLEHPRTTVAGTKMAFPGLTNASDRQNIIAYLKTVK